MANSSHAATFVAFFIVCLVLLLPSCGMAAWALYDGTVYYPELAERYDTYHQLLIDDPQNAKQRWPEVAAQKGWPTDKPDVYGEADIVTQFILSGVCGIMGLILFIGAVAFGLLWRRAEAKKSLSQPVKS